MISSEPSPLVIDAGIGYALCTIDTASSSVRAEMTARVDQGVWLCALSIWQYELTSIFTKAVHFKQLSESSARQALNLSDELRVQLFEPDRELVAQAFDWTLRLKRAAAYDSFYLALARRLNCDLWTSDRRLANAIAAPWIRYMR